MISTRLPRLLTLGAALAFVAAACGPGGTGTAGPGGTTPAATTPAGTTPAGTAATGGSYEEWVPDPALLTEAEGEGGMISTIALPASWCNYEEVWTTFIERTGLEYNGLNPDAGSAEELTAIEANKD